MKLIIQVRNFMETQGLTLLLQAAILGVAVTSVEVAQWVDTPPLPPIVLAAALLAAFTGRRRKLQYVYHAAAIALGVLIAYMSAVYLTAAEDWGLKFDELHARLAEWWLAVTGDDATNDTLPLSMILVLIAWLAAYWTSWSLFKFRSPWISLVSIGVALLVTLTYLPESFFIFMLGFFFLSLVLIVHMTGLKRRTELQSQGRVYPAAMHRLSLAAGLLLSAVTLGATALIPMSDTDTRPLRWALKPIDNAVEDVRGEMYRIFASVPWPQAGVPPILQRGAAPGAARAHWGRPRPLLQLPLPFLLARRCLRRVHLQGVEVQRYGADTHGHLQPVPA